MIDLDQRLERAANDLRTVVGSRAVSPSTRRSGLRFAMVTTAAATLLAGLGAVWLWRDTPVDEAASLPATAASHASVVPVPTALAPNMPGSAGTVVLSDVEYVLQDHDYPATIATEWKISLEELLAANGLTVTADGIVHDWPSVGSTILIPAGATVPQGLDRAGSVAPASSSLSAMDASPITTAIEPGVEMIPGGSVVCVIAGATDRTAELCAQELGGTVIISSEMTAESFVMPVDPTDQAHVAATANAGDLLGVAVRTLDTTWLPRLAADQGQLTYLVLGADEGPYAG